MTGYARPDVLVSTDWVARNLSAADTFRLVESNEDVLLYDTGHIENAVKIDWHNDLQDSITRDYIDAERFAALCARLGIGNDTTVVFYGDKNNWWACYAFWAFTLMGHKNCRIMDGGRMKWVQEGRPLTRAVPRFKPETYAVPSQNPSIRAFRDDVLAHMEKGGALVDVRSPREYSGELTHMPEYPQEGALRGGHIPGAVSVPWSTAANPDGTFKSVDALKAIYEKDQGLDPSEEVIAYCRIGERSSHTWFVLTYLLGFESVKNYDGSWTEWGNLVGAPIERSV